MANEWMTHVKKVRDENPGMGLRDILVKAKASYKKHSSKSSKKHQDGGDALGGSLEPMPFIADPKYPSSGSAEMNIVATQYSTGGAKKSRKHGGKKGGKSHKHSKKGGKKGGKSHKRSRRGGNCTKPVPGPVTWVPC